MHIVLAGDSVFQNVSYTGDGQDVISHVREMLPANWRASLVAVDGATTGTFLPQLEDVSDDVTHIALSLGGNDALGCLPLMMRPTSTVADGLATLAAAVTRFEHAYRACVESVLALGRETVLLTIYNGDLEPSLKGPARAGVALYNDVIQRVGGERQIPVLELRHICTEPADFVYQVEPSGAGGRKVARSVLQAFGCRVPEITGSRRTPTLTVVR